MEDKIDPLGDGMPLQIPQGDFMVGNNEIILNLIFQFSDVETLKSCRLVNKKWLRTSQSTFNKKSLIKLQFEEDEELTAQSFLEIFEDPILSINFTGVLIHFDSFLDNWAENDNMKEFLNVYGNQLTYLKLETLQGATIEKSFFAFKNLLCEFVPNLEHLCVYLNVCPDGGGSVSTPENEGNEFEEDSGATFPNLTKLEWSTFPEDWFDAFNSTTNDDHEKMFTTVLQDLLKSAPHLKSILTEGSFRNSDALKTLSDEGITKIQEIRICADNTFHQVHPFLKTLTELSARNLKLKSFSVTTFENDEEAGDWEGEMFLNWLLKFLESQSVSLQKLQLCIQINDSTINCNNIPNFPKLPNLKHLEFKNESYLAPFLFPNDNYDFNEYFPTLETIKIACNCSITNDENHFNSCPKLLHLFNDNKTVNFVHLHPLIGHMSTFDDAGFQNRASLLFNKLATKFLNLKVFQLYDDDGKTYSAFESDKKHYIFRRTTCN